MRISVDRQSLRFAIVLLATVNAPAQLTVQSEFTAESGLVSAGFDSHTGRVWLYGDFAADLSTYSASGTFIASIPRPGEGANDADMEFASEQFTLGNSVVQAGSLLFINGE